MEETVGSDARNVKSTSVEAGSGHQNAGSVTKTARSTSMIKYTAGSEAVVDLLLVGPARRRLYTRHHKNNQIILNKGVQVSLSNCKLEADVVGDAEKAVDVVVACRSCKDMTILACGRIWMCPQIYFLCAIFGTWEFILSLVTRYQEYS
ncbi:hypothetical protein Scep_014099 [Stephania cephalantha]|uniref:Uncharacterized protein n=1 Tax=Stephania cephalantha TaxID=152367 RepID=A0AAP0J2F9_9MAGN